MTNIDTDCWWTVARSEELNCTRPLGVTCAGHALALWREPNGIPRAVEDRCPHRRVPLSLGCVQDNGWLRCGYHGWTYDGADGKLREIPNLPDRQQFSPVYRAKTYQLHEADGLVHVLLTGSAPLPAFRDSDLPLSGSTAVSLSHDQYIAAFFDAPQLLFAVPGIEFTEYLGCDPHLENGAVVMERSCRYSGLNWPARISADFPLIMTSATDLATGRTELGIHDDSHACLMAALIAPVPAIRNVTAIRWRARMSRKLKHTIKVHQQIDAEQLMATKRSASIEYDKIRLGLRIETRAIT